MTYILKDVTFITMKSRFSTLNLKRREIDEIYNKVNGIDLSFRGL